MKLSELLNKKPKAADPDWTKIAEDDDAEKLDKELEELAEIEDEEVELPDELKFIVMSTYGELLDVAIQLSVVEKYETYFCVTDKEYSRIGKGIVPIESNWHQCLGKKYIWVVDGCENADLQDWLRGQGEFVVGTNTKLSEMENDRQKGQDWFKKAGFEQPYSKNFTDIDECIKFVEDNTDTKWILKQNGDAPKSINYKGKFKDNEDMLFHLEECRKGWNTAEYGPFDCDLMEVVEGMEVAVSGFFNGNDYLRDSDGKVVAFLNFEHKKESDGDTGETTGEMGTLFYGTDEDHDLVRDILLAPEIVKVLKESNYRGVFDINGSWTKDGYVAFEATSRFGIPASSYEFIEGLESNTGELLASMAMGTDDAIKIKKGWGLCQVIAAKPFPVDADLDDEATSRGEKLWIIGAAGNPIKKFNDEQLKHIHLENFERDEEGDYKVATKNGYLLVVTATGNSIADVREECIDTIKNNIFIAGMKYRHDLGKRIEEFEADIEDNTL